MHHEIRILVLLILLSGFFAMSEMSIAPTIPTTEEHTMTYRTAPLLCAFLLLTACSPNDNEPPPPKLFEGQRNALDKAKEVDAEQQKQNEEQRKAIEQQAQ